MGSSPAHLIVARSEGFLRHSAFVPRCQLCSSSQTTTAQFPLARASFKGGGGKKNSRGSSKAATKKKESPWDDVTAQPKTNPSRRSASRGRPSSRKSSKAQPRARSFSKAGPHDDSRVLVSSVMPIEIEKVLQTEEPASIPSWSTFISSLRGVWRGVGAAFSPATAEMEAIALGNQDELLYDCRILSTAEEMMEKGGIRRKTVWAVGNPLGEQGRGRLQVQGKVILPNAIVDDIDGELSTVEDLGMEISEDNAEEAVNLVTQPQNSSDTSLTTDLENPALAYDTVMEEDELELEPGLVFFEVRSAFCSTSKEAHAGSSCKFLLNLGAGLCSDNNEFFLPNQQDGSYSRGPLSLLTGGVEDSTSSTYRIEQCLVRGGHSRLRMVHTLSVEEGGESVQLLRVAVYNEEWMGPCNMKSISDSGGHHLPLFSQQSRLKPQDLVGSWKVFELSVTAILEDDTDAEKLNERPPYVYMSMETQKRRLLPDMPVHFIDEEITDIQDVTVMWLPGGISAYVDVKDEGILTVGVGWFSDGINIVMERDYNTDGKLCEVHSKSEIKGGWVGGRM